MQITITEALAEIKTIGKRLAKKQAFINGYLTTQNGMKDPLAKQGGSQSCIESEMQSIADLHKRMLLIRTKIAQSNATTNLTVGDVTMTVTEWLSWKREIAPSLQTLYSGMIRGVETMRSVVKKQGGAVTPTPSDNPADYVVNFDEKVIATAYETVETILGGLDGKLSLNNATTLIDI